MKKTIVFFTILFNANFAFGFYTEDISNQCGVIHNELDAIFTPNQHICDTGEFLPAYSDVCQSCPSGFSCPGGTYTFNENKFQGAISTSYITHDLINMCSTNVSHELFPVFIPNQHTCNPGYYMPSNHDGCQLCPTDSYCVGGTYTFNKTLTQGIVSCTSGLFAPSGMWESAQCGRILHVGDNVVYLRSVKKTTPSVNVDLDNDEIPDYFGNMTTLDVPMTRGTDRKLKLQYGGQTYSVYDDSVDLTQYQN